MIIVLGTLYSSIGLDESAPANLVAGFLGGFILGIFTLIGRYKSSNGENVGRFFLSGIIVAFLFGLLGGVIATYFTGISGSFITGLTAIGLVAAIVGSNSHESSK